MTNLHYQYNDKTHSLNHGKIEKGYNAFHIHASYDLLEHTYNENAAFIDIAERYTDKKQFLLQIETINLTIYLSMSHIQIINFLFE